MKSNAELVDGIREHKAIAAGLQVELCMRLGDRDGAQRALAEMNALTTARQAAAWIEPCYFAEQGRRDGAAVGAALECSR